MSKARFHLRIPIVAKLTSFTVLLLLGAVVPISQKSAQLFTEVSGQRERDTNRDQAESRSKQVDALIGGFSEKAMTVAAFLLQEFSQVQDQEQTLKMSFERDPDLVHLEIWKKQEAGEWQVFKTLQKDEYFQKLEFNSEQLPELRSRRGFSKEAVFSGKMLISNSSMSQGPQLLTIGMPLAKTEFDEINSIVIADFKIDRLQNIFSNATDRTFYLTDSVGQILAHPNDKWTVESHSVADLDIVKSAMKAKLKRGESRFLDSSTNQWSIGAYSITQNGLIVIAQVSEQVILEPSERVRRQALLIAGIVLSVALFFVFVFSITLTNPINKLVRVTRQIARGEFDVKAEVSTHDEVGELAGAFNQMVDGLKEREKIRNVLNKFHGSTVADDLLSGDLALGGVNREVTVLFSDIRDFTKFSEGHTPEEVVAMLNEYFEIMVGIVTKNHGVVDKFVGDAMMAIWGAPKSTGDDEHFAVRACLEMRQALVTLNDLRKSRGQVEIKIGVGVHAGPAISGNIGSSERMEYTVIGDTVNMSSRIESSTKAFGTDLLVSEEITEKVKGRIITELAGSAEVKGKAKPLKMFKVRGYVDENGQEVLIKTIYSDYEKGEDAKVKVA